MIPHCSLWRVLDSAVRKRERKKQKRYQPFYFCDDCVWRFLLASFARGHELRPSWHFFNYCVVGNWYPGRPQGLSKLCRIIRSISAHVFFRPLRGPSCAMFRIAAPRGGHRNGRRGSKFHHPTAGGRPSCSTQWTKRRHSSLLARAQGQISMGSTAERGMRVGRVDAPPTDQRT